MNEQEREEEVARKRFREAQDFIDNLTGGQVRKGGRVMHVARIGRKAVLYTREEVQTMIDQLLEARSVLDVRVA
jgi:hypothetical protein